MNFFVYIPLLIATVYYKLFTKHPVYLPIGYNSRLHGITITITIRLSIGITISVCLWVGALLDYYFFPIPKL